MHPIPDLLKIDAIFGNIAHLPKWEDLPEEFQRNWSSDRNPYCRAVSSWFFDGAKRDGNLLIVGDIKLKPKPSVDMGKALVAVRAVLGSFEPSHEHKIAGCGYLLSEWFDIVSKGK